MPTETLALLIPILGIVFGIGCGFWAIYWDYRTTQVKYKERQLMIEKGLTPPPMLPDAKRKLTTEDCLRRGTVLLFLGIGLGIGYFILPMLDEDLAMLCGLGGAIVGFLGVGYLVYYFIARKRSPEDSQNFS